MKISTTPEGHPDPHQRIVAYILLVHLRLSYCDIRHGLHGGRDMHHLHLQCEQWQDGEDGQLFCVWRAQFRMGDEA